MNDTQKMWSEFESFARKGCNISSQKLSDYYTHTRNNTLHIIEERPMNIVSLDVFSRLMMDRIIFIGIPIDDYFSNVVIAQLLFLDSVDKHKDIQMYINSPGGAVYSGLGVYDTMQYVSPDISTICVGMAASMAAVLMCAGNKGKRAALKHTRFMLHQASGGVGGQASDIEIMAKEIKELQTNLYEVLALHTGQKLNVIAKDCDRDFWMNAESAKKYGLIDEILVSTPKANRETLL